MKRAWIFVLAASTLGLMGGCDFPLRGQHLPGTPGSSGTSGTTESCAPCRQLDERGCLARNDCAAVYEDTCKGRRFDRCEDKVCPAVTCPMVGGAPCRAAMGADGCPTCECGPTTCQSDADCASGEFCQLLIPVDNPAAQGGSSGAGQCVQRSTCPMIACAQSSDGVPCRVTTGPDGCPTCDCAPTTCNSDADCASGQTCQPIRCNSRACDPPRMVCLPWGTTDGGWTAGDGGTVTADGGATYCMSDADCPSGESCEGCSIDCPTCAANGACLAVGGTCQPSNCGTTHCAGGQVCVHGEGGAPMMLPDGGESPSEWWSCAPYPSSCPMDANTCGCIGQAICNSQLTDCGGAMPVVTCLYPW